MKKKTVFAAATLAAAFASPAIACDICSIYAANEAQGEAGRGFFGGIAEQFTYFGTVQVDGQRVAGEGQYIDSSVSQLFVGYTFNSRFNVEANLPVIYRAWGSDTMHGTESGIGDFSVTGNVTLYRKLEETFSLNWSLLGGIKFPTGNSSQLNTPDSALPEGIGGHDLALGSGSFDGIVGSSFFGHWKKLLFNAGTQYAIRTEGDFQHQYANDLSWSAGPGAYLALTEDYTLAFQAMTSGETKGKDTFAGVPDPDSAETIVYVGPQFNFTWGNRLSAQVGADFPVKIYNSGEQVVPDYRVHAAFTWKF